MAQFFKPQHKASSKAKRQLPVVTLEISGFTLNGQGICKSHSPVVIVSGALPGETVIVQITAQKKQVWLGSVISVITSHAQRIAAPCPFAVGAQRDNKVLPTQLAMPTCGGCQLSFVEPSALLALKQTALDEYVHQHIGAIELPWRAPVLSAPQYRRKARLAIDARDKQAIKVGFRQTSAKTVMAIPQCEVLEGALQPVLNAIHTSSAQWHWLIHVGHITLLESRDQIVVAFNTQQPLSKQALAALQAFSQAHEVLIAVTVKGVPKGVPSLPHNDDAKWLTLHWADDNDAMNVSLAQPDLWLTSIDECQYPVGLDDFIQVNASLNQAMIYTSIDLLALAPDDRVVDLFCGSGNFSVPIAKQTEYVLGIEGVEAMVQQANQGAVASGVDNVTFLHADLTTSEAMHAIKAAKCNKLLLDPSREGAKAILAQVDLQQFERIVYVSCNPQSWVHDIQLLLDAGFACQHTQFFDMFAGTTHTELVSVFTR